MKAIIEEQTASSSCRFFKVRRVGRQEAIHTLAVTLPTSMPSLRDRAFEEEVVCERILDYAAELLGPMGYTEVHFKDKWYELYDHHAEMEKQARLDLAGWNGNHWSANYGSMVLL